ncbi:MAG: protein kinase domain-containing protein [Planctomyces sp.]|jgi:predicted Ser/Thr protein kinase
MFGWRGVVYLGKSCENIAVRRFSVGGDSARCGMSERKFGPFVVGEQIGVGGMGVVYRALHPETGRTAALKILPPGLDTDPKMQQRFEREIGILKRLQHPNIVRYYGGGYQGGQRWYAMEFIDGGSLQDVLKRRGRLTPLQVIQAGRQLCAALEHAHNAGIIHRDLKPANLLLTSQGRLKLGDFGIARDTESTALTGAGRTVGTYAYMAPEQIHGSEHIDRRTDLYAAGCLLYELLCGETPFTENNPAAMLMAHVDSIPRSVRERCSDCPAALDRLIARLLEKKPEDRPWDALAVHTELGEIQQQLKQGAAGAEADSVGESVPAGRAGQRTTVSGGAGTATKEAVRGRKKKKRGRTVFYEQVWFLSLCLLLLTGLVVWLLRGPGEEDLYRGAAAALQQSDPVVLDDARRKFVLPYLQRYPEGQHVPQMRQWLDEIDVGQLLLQAERRLRGNRDGRNAVETAGLAALRAERQDGVNPLEVLEQYQVVLELTEAAGGQSGDAEAEQRRLWRLQAERRQAELRAQLLQREDLGVVVSERFVAAEKLRQAGSEAAVRLIYQRFAVMFSAESRLEALRDCARERAEGRVAELPPF